MRHRIAHRKLGRVTPHRLAMLKSRRFAVPLAAVALVAQLSCAPATAPNEPAADATSGSAPDAFKQIGYLPWWAGSVSGVQYQYLTHVNYAFALPNPGGTLQPIENASKLASL